MTAPTVEVTAKLSSFGGPALAGVVITATADKDDNYQGLILRKTVTATTDTNGEAVFNLFPNALATAALPGLGTTGSTYRFTASVPNGWRMDVSAQVPNVACDLHSIVMADDAELPTPGEVAGAVRYDIAQTLTSPQQAQARANIGFDAAVRAVALTGLSLATATAVTAADSVLVAFGKAQAQITALDTAKANLSGAAFTGAVSATSFTGPLTGNVTGNVSGSAPAGSLAGTTLAANVVNASLNSITPTGGVLAVTGNVSATGSLQAGAGGDGALSSVRSDNTSTIASGVNLSRGNATGTNVNISTTGDGANGVAAALLRFDGTEVMRWQPGNVAVTGSISATATAETFISTAATTSPRSLHLANTSGDVYFGIEGSSSGGFFTGSTAYATVVYSTQRVQTIIGGVKRTEVDSSGITVTGSISATSLVDISAAGAGQIKFPATQNASADANTLDDYQEATYTGTATGMTTSPTGTVSYTLTGNEATLNLPEITGTSNATTFTVTGMPAEARPASRKTVLGRAQDNGGAIVPVRIDIETTGVLTIYANADAGAFTASGSKTLAECSVTYTRV